jgi:branched-chain amino acid transport system substrate-binding protein
LRASVGGRRRARASRWGAIVAAGAAITLLLPASIAGAGGADTATGKATGTPIKIGLIANEGGTAVSLPQVTKAAVAAAKYANASLKGIGNHVITLDTCKEQEDDASAQACANKMVEDGVSAVVVGITAEGGAMAPTITQAGIPYITITGTAAAEFTLDNVFFDSSGVPGLFGGMAAQAKDKGYKKLTVLAGDTGSLIAGLKALGKPFFDAAGVDFEVVGIPPGTADTSAQITSASSGNPDAIAIVGDETLCISTLKGMQTLSLKKPIWTIPSCSGDSVQKAVPGALNGAVIFTNSDPTSNDPEAKLYRKVMKQYAPKVKANSDATYGYQSMMGLIYAAAGLGDDTSPAAVIAAIKAAKDVPVPAGHGVTFTCDGNQWPGNALFRNFCATGELVTKLKGKPTATQTTYKVIDAAAQA